MWCAHLTSSKLSFYFLDTIYHRAVFHFHFIQLPQVSCMTCTLGLSAKNLDSWKVHKKITVFSYAFRILHFTFKCLIYFCAWHFCECWHVGERPFFWHVSIVFLSMLKGLSFLHWSAFVPYKNSPVCIVSVPGLSVLSTDLSAYPLLTSGSPGYCSCSSFMIG